MDINSLMTTSLTYSPDGVESFMGFTPLSWGIFASSGLLVTMALFIAITGCVYCRKPTRGSIDLTSKDSKGNSRSPSFKDHYDVPNSSETDTIRISKVKRVVQINIETDMDGKTSISQTNFVAEQAESVTEHMAEPIPPRKAVSFREQTDGINKTGTLPKYENTAIKSKKNYQHHELQPRPKPAVESPYDYPSSNTSSPCLKPKCDRNEISEIVGYMEVLPDIPKEPLYEPLNTKL